MDAETRKMFKFLERAVVALEKIAGIDAPAEVPKPPMTEAQLKDRVTLVRRNEKTPEWDGSGLPPGGGDVDPRTFWSRPDEYAAAKKRPAKKMGRPFRP